MPSAPLQVNEVHRICAMRDASAGAFEAARIRYRNLLNEAESISIDYVYGKIPEARVRAIAEQLLEAEFVVKETARKTRLYQEEVNKLKRFKIAADAKAGFSRLNGSMRSTIQQKVVQRKAAKQKVVQQKVAQQNQTVAPAQTDFVKKAYLELSIPAVRMSNP